MANCNAKFRYIFHFAISISFMVLAQYKLARLPVSALDQVTKSGICVVVLMLVLVGVVFVAFCFGNAVDELETNGCAVIIGFFLCGGVGLVPLDVMIVDCTVVANFDGEVFVGPEIENFK